MVCRALVVEASTPGSSRGLPCKDSECNQGQHGSTHLSTSVGPAPEHTTKRHFGALQRRPALFIYIPPQLSQCRIGLPIAPALVPEDLHQRRGCPVRRAAPNEEAVTIHMQTWWQGESRGLQQPDGRHVHLLEILVLTGQLHSSGCIPVDRRPFAWRNWGTELQWQGIVPS